MNTTRIENWNGNDIHFEEINGVWYGSILDIASAIDMPQSHIFNCINDNDVIRMSDDNMGICEAGLYQYLMNCHSSIATKFRGWAADSLAKLRRISGLKPYEFMRMLDDDTQENIDNILDTIYWDEEKKCLMRSVTVMGGDVEQLPLEG